MPLKAKGSCTYGPPCSNVVNVLLQLITFMEYSN